MTPVGRGDVPGPGHLISTTADPVAATLRSAADALRKGAMPTAVNAYNRQFACLDPDLGVEARPADSRVVWSLMGMWLVHAAVSAEQHSLSASEAWFVGQPGRLCSAFDDSAISS